ncbi:MAG: hypothetical protein EU541_07560, partial [Promethearchaeota archaeon]
MNVLRISTRIYPGKSGPAKQAYLLSKFLSKNKNFKNKIINIACNPYDYPVNEKIINRNFKIYYLPLKAPGINAGTLKLIKFFFQFFILALVKSFIIIKKENINIIHSHSPAPSGFIAYIIKLFFKIPYVYTIHGVEKIINIIHILDFKLTIKSSDKTLVVSRTLKKHLEKQLKLKNLKWFPNGVNIKNYFHVKNDNE